MRELAAATSQQGVLTVTAKWMPLIISSERSSIALPHDGVHLQIYALSGSLILPQGTRLPIATSIVGEAFASQEIVKVDDLAMSTGSEAHVLREAGLRSALVCPITVGGRSLGTVNLGNRKRNFFTTEHIQLLSAVVDLIASFLSVHARAQSEHDRANTDHLTDALSRGGILDHLEHEFTFEPRKPSLLYLDVDGFKAINDTHGHLVGDEVLRVFAQRISGVIRDFDRVGRLGGDEFLVVVRRDPNGRTARRIAERIEEVCTMPIIVRSICIQPAVSIGLASIENSTSTADDLLHDADQAMYASKTADRRITVADETIRDRAIMIAAIDRDLDRGMESGEITYHFQPIRDITTREIMGAEALIRWTHPQLGSIPAPLLIDRLEKTGRTEAFTRWSLETVASHWSIVHSELPWTRNKAVSLNLTPRQLSWQGYADLHFETLTLHGFRPQDIIVEVVESAEIETGDAAERTLKQLGEGDVVIALDDFGTGHNALGYFTMFPIHAIKFDRSLVGIAEENHTARTILAGLASLSHELGVVSLGEGVETEAEARICQQLGITHGQGWHFGRPGPLAKMIELLRQEGPRGLDAEHLYEVGS